MLSSFLSICLWLCVIVGFLGVTTATPVGKDPATLESLLHYTYTPIYYTEADVSAYAAAVSAASADSTASATSDPPSTSDSNPPPPTSPNPTHHTKRFWPFDGPAWKDFYVFRNPDHNAPNVGKYNCPLMLEACNQHMAQLPYGDERRKYAKYECRQVLCVQTKKACGYVAGWMC